MDKRYLTLFVLTNDASRSRQLKIPFRLLKGFGAASVFLFLVFSFVVFDYARLKTNYFSLATLKKENTAQRIELQTISGKIKDLEGQIAKLNIFDRKIRIIANISDPKNTASSEQLMGMGGDSSAEENYFSTPGAKKNELVKKMRDEITQLEEMARSQENSFTELQEYLMKKSSFLAATPSIWPARGWVTSTFGERISPFTGFPQMHSGLDIANRVGTQVIAPADGIVVKVGPDSGLGKMITISHGYGIKTTYGHLSETKVRSGQKVKRGMEIGTMGNTGRSTGPHLHYSVSLNGVAVNPAKYILN